MLRDSFSTQSYRIELQHLTGTTSMSKFTLSDLSTNISLRCIILLMRDICSYVVLIRNINHIYILGKCRRFKRIFLFSNLMETILFCTSVTILKLTVVVWPILTVTRCIPSSFSFLILTSDNYQLYIYRIRQIVSV